MLIMALAEHQAILCSNYVQCKSSCLFRGCINQSTFLVTDTIVDEGHGDGAMASV